MASEIMNSGEAWKRGLFKKGRSFTTYNSDDVIANHYTILDGCLLTDGDGDRYFSVLNEGNQKETKFYTHWKGGTKVQFEETNFNLIGGGKKMLESVTGEVKEFVAENKTILYWFAIIFVADYYIFDGKFKDKLENIFSSIIDKVTSVISKADAKEASSEES